jgi:hypothetical protein
LSCITIDPTAPPVGFTLTAVDGPLEPLLEPLRGETYDIRGGRRVEFIGRAEFDRDGQLVGGISNVSVTSATGKVRNFWLSEPHLSREKARLERARSERRSVVAFIAARRRGAHHGVATASARPATCSRARRRHRSTRQTACRA